MWYKIYIIKIFKVKIHDKMLPHILYVLRVYDLFPMLMQKKKTKECKSFKCQIANNVVLRLTRAWLLSFLIFGICLVLWTKICDGLSFIFEYRSSFFFLQLNKSKVYHYLTIVLSFVLSIAWYNQSTESTEYFSFLYINADRVFSPFLQSDCYIK